ncbi:5-formyltetrahydrofolate cyclo-ligase [Nakamurella leprariae]|uniref:5-formyltetrahydrofolate cyclo-ligase n=1 Tax=Nakamurella leprariae TaxID=2803911 RepID=A0A938YG09_9ACTN|nr:5-formyltetrahydrofolate cyclo-ligase [Nakamurella leprariae]MBM9467459.1 5-formyltetrahydrofolate cyclo-ligase [Nakamurella leprariae]
MTPDRPNGDGPDRTGQSATSSVPDAKAALRRELLDRRRSRPDAERQAAREAVGGHVTALADTLTVARNAAITVAAFLPLPTEPLDPVALPALAARGVRVLVPAVTGASPLDWVQYRSAATTVGEHGIEEPAGPRLGPDAIGTVHLVLVPALAVDRTGHRLGRGGGHYDRTLALLDTVGTISPPPPLLAVVFDDEVLDALPADPLDHPVTHVVTPRGGVRAVGSAS